MTAVLSGASTRRPSGLPAEVTSFVGRRHEAAEAKRLLSSARVVTLTGVGGVGKTRLALRVAADARRQFPDGIWLVELAPLDNPELLAQAVVESLEICDLTHVPALDLLVDHLADRQALIVLDNCEHLLRECAELADALVHALPQLTILATSRQALGIVSEQVLNVAPLPVRDLSAGSAISLMSGEPPVESDAIRLFAERAAAVVQGFEVTAANQEAVEAVCRRLDGLPLAIELAAVRLRALSVEQVLDRLDDRFRLLTSGSRAAFPRQRTLRALMDWSYELCTGQERLLWQRVSVFTGGLDLEAAEEVCSGDGIAATDVLDLVTGLVDKSILVREEQRGAVRYRLLETIRQYGKERLAASSQERAMRRRHGEYYRSVAADARAELFGPTQVTWFARLSDEQANLRTALEFFFSEPCEYAKGLAMTTDLLYHWIKGYYLGEGRRWLEEGLALEPAACEGEQGETRARALCAAAWVTIVQTDSAAAAALLEEAGRLAEELGSEETLAYVILYQGMVAVCRGDADTAIKLHQEAAERQRCSGDPAGLALALIQLSLAYSLVGEALPAVTFAEQAMAVCDAHKEGWHRAYAMTALGIGLWRQGESRRATALEKDALRFDDALGDAPGLGMCLEVLAWIAVQEKRHDRAARILGIADGVWRVVGVPLSGFGQFTIFHDECVSRAQEALGEQGYRSAAREGAGLPYGEAITYALQEESSSAKPVERTGRLAPLTRRETEIAGLVAQGLSNKEIAGTLIISQRTAEGHIEHILNKLGFNSRAQIAAWLSERQGSTPAARTT
ncbi:LuxR family transcriptional regulator [Planotetraspora thailandica]|uniref:LuxR family transcriptional regulator n=1 Tax=Planotetraspora thailandica TaxID=487172 RepID=A0A8J3VBA5_9ACTN|nr:LuxR C-terminal-related transcriptional regulator [Planotetraspora thailandica]GII53760.1 LuxR family transcriptional regulator [Planotetraspora thailandica]